MESASGTSSRQLYGKFPVFHDFRQMNSLFGRMEFPVLCAQGIYAQAAGIRRLFEALSAQNRQKMRNSLFFPC